MQSPSSAPKVLVVVSPLLPRGKCMCWLAGQVDGSAGWCWGVCWTAEFIPAFSSAITQSVSPPPCTTTSTKKKKKRGLAKTFISSEEKMNGKDLDRYCDHTSHVSLPSETTPVVSQKGKKHHKNCSSAAKFGLQSKIPTELTLSNLSKWR